MCRILSAIGDPDGSRLADIVSLTGLNKVSVLRILEVLRKEGFVEKNEARKTYGYGEKMRLVAAGVSVRDTLQVAAHESVLRLAKAFGDTITLYRWSGSVCICVDLAVGDRPLSRGNTVRVGSRRPLGIGAGPTTILAWLSEPERQAAMMNLSRNLRRYRGINVPAILSFVSDTVDRGYCFTANTLIKGVGGIGMPITDDQGRLVGALAASSVVEHVVSQQDRLVELLWQESLRIRANMVVSCDGPRVDAPWRHT